MNKLRPEIHFRILPEYNKPKNIKIGLTDPEKIRKAVGTPNRKRNMCLILLKIVCNTTGIFLDECQCYIHV